MITLQWNENAIEFLHEDLPGSEKLTPVFSIYNGESQWKQMFALFSPEEKLFYWIIGSGCECCDSLFSDVSSLSELKTGSNKELKRVVRAFLKEVPEIMTDAEKEKVFSKVNKFR